MPRDDPAITLLPLTLQDLAPALAIQAQAYPAFLVEDEAAFASRITLSRSHCFAAKRDGQLVGYILAHAWPRQSPPAVGAVLSDGEPAEVLYIHDLAIAAAGRGIDLGRRLVRRAFDAASLDGLGRAELIAVEGAAAYWRTLGFHEESPTAGLAAKLATYGADARWMVRAITKP